MKKILQITLLSLCFIGAAGCASKPDPATLAAEFAYSGVEMTLDEITLGETHYWSISELTDEVGIAGDSWEAFNRSMDYVNYYGMYYLIRPIGTIYGSILPHEVIYRLNNVSQNLNAPARIVSSLLQAHFGDAGIEFSRFLINSTVGIAGIWDAAYDIWDLYARQDDFGKAFQSWGIGSGPVITLPMVQNNYLRDHIGSIFDYALSLKIWYMTIGFGFNELVLRYPEYDWASFGDFDRYSLFRDYYALSRKLKLDAWELNFQLAAWQGRKAAEQMTAAEQIREFPPKPDPWQDSIRFVLAGPDTSNRSIWGNLSLWNSDFRNKVRRRSAVIYPGRPALSYGFIPNRTKNKNAPLVVILPGAGGFYYSNTALMLAEKFYLAGDCSILMMSNTLNWEFRAADKKVYGGMPDADMELLKDAYSVIRDELKQDFDCEPEKVILAGYSLGAMQSLMLAADGEIQVDHLLAINPPVNLLYAVGQLDGCRDVGRKYSEEELIDMAADGLGKVMVLGSNPEYADRLDISTDQAKFLISLSFGYSLRELIAVEDHYPKEPEPGSELFVPNLPFFLPNYRSFHRTAFYTEVDKLSFEDYFRLFIMPQYPDLDEQAFKEMVDLRNYRDFMRNDKRITVLHNLNDFLIDDDDREFLIEALGDKIFWFESGGHLGNLYLPEYHDKLNQVIAPMFGQNAIVNVVED